jgi:hypothetical protein
MKHKSGEHFYQMLPHVIIFLINENLRHQEKRNEMICKEKVMKLTFQKIYIMMRLTQIQKGKDKNNMFRQERCQRIKN